MRRLLTVKCCANCAEIKRKSSGEYYCKVVDRTIEFADELRDKYCRGHKWRKGVKR